MHESERTKLRESPAYGGDTQVVTAVVMAAAVGVATGAGVRRRLTDSPSAARSKLFDR
jgi:hypothetical protein